MTKLPNLYFQLAGNLRERLHRGQAVGGGHFKRFLLMSDQQAQQIVVRFEAAAKHAQELRAILARRATFLARDDAEKLADFFHHGEQIVITSGSVQGTLRDFRGATGAHEAHAKENHIAQRGTQEGLLEHTPQQAALHRCMPQERIVVHQMVLAAHEQLHVDRVQHVLPLQIAQCRVETAFFGAQAQRVDQQLHKRMRNSLVSVARRSVGSFGEDDRLRTPGGIFEYQQVAV